MALFQCETCDSINFSKVCNIDLQTTPSGDDIASEKTSQYLCTKCATLYTLAVNGAVVNMTSPNYFQRYMAESLSESSTVSMTWINKIALQTDSIPGGIYRIGWSAETRPNNYVNGLFGGQVQVDNNEKQILSTVKFNMIYGELYQQWLPWSGFSYVALEEGKHIIDMDFRAERTAYTVKIRNAILELWSTESTSGTSLITQGEAIPLQ